MNTRSKFSFSAVVLYTVGSFSSIQFASFLASRAQQGVSLAMFLPRILGAFLFLVISLVFSISARDQSSPSQSSVTGSATEQASQFQSSVTNSATDQPSQSRPSVTGNATLAGLPDPTESPVFGYKFQLNFGGGKCSVPHQNKLRKVFNNMAGLADRIQLWRTDAFFDWSNDVNNWLGSDSGKSEAYIKSMYLGPTLFVPDHVILSDPGCKIDD